MVTSTRKLDLTISGPEEKKGTNEFSILAFVFFLFDVRYSMFFGALRLPDKNVYVFRSSKLLFLLNFLVNFIFITDCKL